MATSKQIKMYMSANNATKEQAEQYYRQQSEHQPKQEKVEEKSNIVPLNKMSQTFYKGLVAYQHQANNDWFAMMWNMLNMGGLQCTSNGTFQKVEGGFIKI